MINIIDNYIAAFSWMIFLGGAPTSICHFFCLSVHPSVHPSVAHHISGTVDHLTIIFGTHMQNDDISRAVFFVFSKFWFFRLLGGKKGKKQSKITKKFSLLHSIPEKPYIICLSFMVNIYKMVISSSVFFIFSQFWFSGSIGE